MRTFGWTLAALAVILGGVGGAAVLVALRVSPPQIDRSDVAALVETATLARAADANQMQGFGFVSARERVDLIAEVSGRIISVAEGFESAGQFDAGSMLIELDKGPYLADVKAREADLAAAQAGLSQAVLEAERQELLATRGDAARASFERARAEREQAAAAVALANAQLDLARIRLDDTTLTAPFPMIVESESAAVGAYVTAGMPVARIFTSDAAEVVASFARADAVEVADALRGLAEGDRLSATVSIPDTGVVRVGYVDRVAPALDARDRTVGVVVRVAGAFNAFGADPALQIGDYVTVSVRTPAQANAPTVLQAPLAALDTAGRIWRVTDEDTISPSPVTVVGRSGDVVRFTADDLVVGDTVLLTDLPQRAPGMAVRRADALTAPSDTAALMDR